MDEYLAAVPDLVFFSNARTSILESCFNPARKVGRYSAPGESREEAARCQLENESRTALLPNEGAANTLPMVQATRRRVTSFFVCILKILS